MFPSTRDRVVTHTPPHLNEEIRRKTEESIGFYAQVGPEAIERRLDELDREWDTERTLEANAAAFSLAGLALGTWVDRRFFALPAVVAGFLLQHSIQGWCPPVSLIRRMGYRTMSEIDSERYALKALRGDFDDLMQVPERTAPEFATAAVEAATR